MLVVKGSDNPTEFPPSLYIYDHKVCRDLFFFDWNVNESNLLSRALDTVQDWYGHNYGFFWVSRAQSLKEILCSCLLAPPSTHCLIFIDFSVLDFTWVKHLICGLIVMPGLLSLIMFWGSFNLWHESVMDSLPLPIVHSLYGYAHLSFNKHMSWLYLWLLWIMKLENCIDSLCFHLSSVYF